MNAERRQGRFHQRTLFEGQEGDRRPGAGGEGGTGPAAREESQTFTASERKRALTAHLMERVVERENLNKAYKRAKANKGAPGVDGMTVGDLRGWLKEHREALLQALQAGMMSNGVYAGREEGTPQGGPLSPILANLLLDDLDKELEQRGHRYCRYADDCNIYARTVKAGERVMVSVSRFLEEKLRLKVNHHKSAVAYVGERKFLGHRLLSGGRQTIAPKSLERAKERIRKITRRNRGISFTQMIRELNVFLNGWVAYYRYAECKTHLQRLDEWIRRKLRCVRLKQRKRAKPIADFLM